MAERVTLAGPFDGCDAGNHAWEIVGAGNARCVECGDESTWTKTDLYAAQALSASRGKGAGQGLLQAVLDRNVTSLRTVEEE